MTEKRKEGGDASGLEVSVAWVDARSAGELAARAEGDLGVAQARMRNLLGLRNDARVVVAEGRQGGAALPEEVALVEKAWSARPDLRSAEITVEAAAERAKWQRTRVLNMLIPVLSVKESGSPVQTRVGPGVQLELPVFNRNQGQIARADAEVVQASWRYAALRERVELEVREARQRAEQARRSSEQLRVEVRPAVEAAIRQTETARSSGDATLLNVLEATRQRFDVELRELDAQAGWMRAVAELERAVGGTI
jgi:cobalt-zinc-cadmium efflux system outer membrane protein